MSHIPSRATVTYALCRQVPCMQQRGVRIETSYGELELGEQDSQAVAALVKMPLERKLNELDRFDSTSTVPERDAAGFRLDSPIIGECVHGERLERHPAPVQVEARCAETHAERHSLPGAQASLHEEAHTGQVRQ